MPHWRDGGIGNMPGSDDRPIEEWTLLEKLAEISATPFGGPMPRCLLGPFDWARPMSKIAKEAFDEIVRLRAEVSRLELAVVHDGPFPPFGNHLALAARLLDVHPHNDGDTMAPTPLKLLKEVAEALKGGGA